MPSSDDSPASRPPPGTPHRLELSSTSSRSPVSVTHTPRERTQSSGSIFVVVGRRRTGSRRTGRPRTPPTTRGPSNSGGSGGRGTHRRVSRRRLVERRPRPRRATRAARCGAARAAPCARVVDREPGAPPHQSAAVGCHHLPAVDHLDGGAEVEDVTLLVGACRSAVTGARSPRARRTSSSPSAPVSSHPSRSAAAANDSPSSTVPAGSCQP